MFNYSNVYLWSLLFYVLQADGLGFCLGILWLCVLSLHSVCALIQSLAQKSLIVPITDCDSLGGHHSCSGKK